MTIRSLITTVLFLAPVSLSAQAADGISAVQDTLAGAEVLSTPDAPSGPIGPYLLIGGAYSRRRDDCPLCSGLDDDDNFTRHLRLGIA